MLSRLPSETDRILWGTDLHLLQFPKGDALLEFSERLRELCGSSGTPPLALAGDIGWQGQGKVPYLQLDAELIGLDNLVLTIRGNHDLAPPDVRASSEYFREAYRFRDVDGVIIHLNDKSCLIGENGYPDLRTAGPDLSQNLRTRGPGNLSFPEFFRGGEHTLFGVGRLMREKADQSTVRALANIRLAFQQYREVVFLTHYPPFREAAYHAGRMGTHEQCSLAVNQRLGEELLSLMSDVSMRDRNLVVLCGHTHHGHTERVRDNLTVHVGWGNRRSREGGWEGPPAIETLYLAA